MIFKNKTFVFITIFALLLIGLAIAAPESVANAAFTNIIENRPADWYYGVSGVPDVIDLDEAEFDRNVISISDDSYFGDKSIMITLTEPQTSYLKSKTLAIGSRETYSISLYVKPQMTLNEPSSKGFFIDFIYYDSNNEYLWDEWIYFNNTDLWHTGNHPIEYRWEILKGDWKKIIMKIDTPEKAAKLNVLFGLDGDYSGSVLIDEIDLGLPQLTEPTKEPDVEPPEGPGPV